MRIHKAGYKIIFVSFLFFVGLNYVFIKFFSEHKILNSVIQLWSGVTFTFILAFFRDPSRKIHENPYFILSPADGTIIDIKEVEENEYFKRPMLMISIFMSIFNVHKNWIPVSGEIVKTDYHKGKFLIASKEHSYLHNEHNNVVMHTVTNHEILVRQVAGKVARRIFCKVKPQDKVKQGDELGFIKFGSRVDVVLPLEAKVKVKLRQKVFGGLTVLADLYEKNSEK